MGVIVSLGLARCIYGSLTMLVLGVGILYVLLYDIVETGMQAKLRGKEVLALN